MVHACKKHTHRHTHTHPSGHPFFGSTLLARMCQGAATRWSPNHRCKNLVGDKPPHRLATRGWQEAARGWRRASSTDIIVKVTCWTHNGTHAINRPAQTSPAETQPTHTQTKTQNTHRYPHTHTHTPPKHSFFVQVCRHTCAGVQKHTGHQITHAKTLLTAGRHRLAKAGVSCAPAAPHGPPMASCQLPARVSLRQHLPGLPMLRELMGQATVHGSSILILM